MDMLKTPFLADMMRLSKEIYAKGWGEANGGNISMRITPEEMFPFQHCLTTGITTKLPFSLPELAGDYFLVTGTGVFYRNIADYPHESLGIVKISDDGNKTTMVWGYTSGGRPTSELPAHLLSHAVRKKNSQGKDKIVLHTHATNLIALSFVLPLDTRVVTKELWEMMSECVVLFPDGIGVMPWMMPGSLEIGHATAELMKSHSLVMWAHHGIFGAGKNMDQVFGLIETADKAAEMLLKVMAAGGKKQAITPEELKALANAFGLAPLAGVLD
ncbi:rhamnulose-1-phosphate aldolase [Desulfovibrio inopinatus]|uniref:rhamnulose-1-phosphate aldolase n=1 Tax=Desulfovibrio inopinatus TaxID=102109 RepID=UPI00041D8731|nr:rhamnulose-1-phosphate aldolase [Desulfovibrio inopinatus]